MKIYIICQRCDDPHYWANPTNSGFFNKIDAENEVIVLNSGMNDDQIDDNGFFIFEVIVK